MNAAPIVLVPGFWIGAWAWDEVVSLLRADGYTVEALTLPGLESRDADRASITFEDHVAAIQRAVEATGEPVVLAVHSGAGGPGYAVSDRIPAHIAAMLYVDTGPATGPVPFEFDGDELPMPSIAELRQSENLDGLSDEQLATMAARAIPEPGGAVRGSAHLTDDSRLDLPSVVLCTSMPSTVIKEAAAAGQPWLGDLARLRRVTYLDLPTSHWPMWSKPAETAEIIARVAREYGPEA